MNKKNKPIAIGYTKDDNFEFGEFYHLATALILKPELNYVLVGDRNCKISENIVSFIKSFKSPNSTISSLDYNKQRNKYCYSNIGNTADIFKYYIGQYEKLSKVKDTFTSKIDDLIKDTQKDKIQERIKKLNLDTDSKKCFIWIRKGDYQPERNISSIGLYQLENVLADFDIKTVFIGKSLGNIKKNETNLIDFFNDEPFDNYNILTQLYFYQVLIKEYNFLFSVGMKSGAMDGLAFAFNFKTFYFATNDSNDRMKKVSEVFNQLVHINLNGTKKDKFISFHDDDIRRLINVINDCVIL